VHCACSVSVYHLGRRKEENSLLGALNNACAELLPSSFPLSPRPAAFCTFHCSSVSCACCYHSGRHFSCAFLWEVSCLLCYLSAVATCTLLLLCLPSPFHITRLFLLTSFCLCTPATMVEGFCRLPVYTSLLSGRACGGRRVVVCIAHSSCFSTMKELCTGKVPSAGWKCIYIFMSLPCGAWREGKALTCCGMYACLFSLLHGGGTCLLLLSRHHHSKHPAGRTSSCLGLCSVASLSPACRGRLGGKEEEDSAYELCILKFRYLSSSVSCRLCYISVR